MMGGPWDAWDWDAWTWAWVAWIAAFIALETVTLLQGRGQELTAHLRPVFLEHPLTWWIGFGFWLWLGLHFLAPAAEARLLDLVRGG